MSSRDRTEAQATFRRWWEDNGGSTGVLENQAWRLFRAGWHSATPFLVDGKVVTEYANKIIERASDSGSFEDGEVVLLLSEFARALLKRS